jgi:hypothetical protein
MVHLVIELRGPWEWQNNPEYPVAEAGTCPTKRFVGGTSNFLCECPEPCDEALAAKRAAVNAYYKNVFYHGEITARDYIDPSDIGPRGGVFLPEAFGKAEPEVAAVLLLYYFQQLGVWAPFRPDNWSEWLKERAHRRDVRGVVSILSNPFMAPGFASGFWALVDRGFIVPVVPLNEGEPIGDRLVHVTQEFILRCYLSTSGLQPKLRKFASLLTWLKGLAVAS